MREIIARTKPLTSFRGPAESIAGSQKEDADIRSLCDEDIRGKVIRNVSWSDNRFVLEFDDGFYLNITAQRDGISCSLDTTPILPDLAIESDTEIVLNLDGFVRKWHRGPTARTLVGRTLEQLWFGADVIYLYFSQRVMSFHLIESISDNTPLLFWEETVS